MPTPLSPSATDEIWVRMASRYGHAWVSQYGADPAGIAGAEWRSTLGGLNATQLRRGFELDQGRGSEWPPSSTAFRALCLDIPSLADVRLEVTRRIRAGRSVSSTQWPFLRLVWSFVDSYRYANTDSANRADRMLRDAYEMAREHVIFGGELPEILAEIEAPKPEPRKPAAADVVAANLAAMKAALGDGEAIAEQGDCNG